MSRLPQLTSPQTINRKKRIRTKALMFEHLPELLLHIKPRMMRVLLENATGH
ncbi:MAG: hypothetical protein AB8G77_18160 [Rhodothermales bacterium]